MKGGSQGFEGTDSAAAGEGEKMPCMN